jgi:amidohydrolase
LRPSSLLSSLAAELERHLSRAIALRHELHSRPELAHKEVGSGELVAAALDGEVERPLGTALLAATPRGDGLPVVLRAELDGLPIEEQSPVAWAARNGAMHACGHDVHMAALVAVIWTLRHLRPPQLPPAIALFQPSEEADPSGARLIVEGDVLPNARAVVAAHVHPDLPWRSVAAPLGPVNASCDYIRIVVHGAGGHAAYPQCTHDPVLALSAVVVAAQQLVSRRTDPLRSAVLAVTCLQAGASPNIVPDSASAHGTLRVLAPADRQRLRDELGELVSGIARAHGCSAELEVTEGEPALVNDPALAAAVRDPLRALGFSAEGAFRSCGSDDLSFYGNLAPTLMLFVGLDGAPEFVSRPLHDAQFVPPDAAVGLVARALVAGFVAASEQT